MYIIRNCNCDQNTLDSRLILAAEVCVIWVREICEKGEKIK